MRPVGHAIVGAVIATVVRFAMGQPVPSMGIFLAAMISAVLDLDTTEEEPHNTPFGHSILLVLVWNSLGLAIVFIFQNNLDFQDLALGITIGLWIHLVIDIIYREPVYTIPTSFSIPRILSVSPIGNDFEKVHDGGLAVSAPWAIYQRLAGGELAWPYWGRVALAESYVQRIVLLFSSF
jgi:hypothetical protein